MGEENDRMVRLEQYLDRLSRRQRRILLLLADSYGASKIKNMLQISQKEYADAMDGIQSYENISILF